MQLQTIKKGKKIILSPFQKSRPLFPGSHIIALCICESKACKPENFLSKEQPLSRSLFAENFGDSRKFGQIVPETGDANPLRPHNLDTWLLAASDHSFRLLLKKSFTAASGHNITLPPENSVGCSSAWDPKHNGPSLQENNNNNNLQHSNHPEKENFCLCALEMTSPKSSAQDVSQFQVPKREQPGPWSRMTSAWQSHQN